MNEFSSNNDDSSLEQPAIKSLQSDVPTINKKNESVMDEIMNNDFLTKYPILIIICIHFSFLADGVEMTLMTVLIIPMKTYFNLSTFQIQLVAATLFLGVALGSFSSGWLSKSVGRIASLKFTLFLLLISHLMMAISLSEGMFICTRILIGYSLGVIIPISLSLYSEFIPIKIRGCLLLMTWFFFFVGYVLNGVIAYCEMPNLEMSKTKKVLTILTIFPFLSFLVNVIFLTDSPRNLMLNNQFDKAFKILKSINKEREISTEQKQVMISEVMTEANITTSGSIYDLFSKQYRFTTIICIFLFFVNGCNFYGVSIVTTLTQQEITIEEEEVNNKSIIRSQIIIAFVTMFSSVIGGILIEIPFVGRKGVLWIWQLINALLLLPAVYFPKLFTFFMSVSNFACSLWGNVLITYIVEIYPTMLRDTSSGFLLMIYRLSCLISQFLYLGLFEIHYKIVYYLSTILLFLGVIATLILPFESVNKPLDIQYEAEKDRLVEIDSILKENSNEGKKNI